MWLPWLVGAAFSQGCPWSYACALVNSSCTNASIGWVAFVSFQGNFFNVASGAMMVPAGSIGYFTVAGDSPAGCPGSIALVPYGPSGAYSFQLNPETLVYGSCPGLPPGWYTNVLVTNYVATVHYYPVIAAGKDGKAHVIGFYKKIY